MRDRAAEDGFSRSRLRKGGIHRQDAKNAKRGRVWKLPLSWFGIGIGRMDDARRKRVDGFWVKFRFLGVLGVLGALGGEFALLCMNRVRSG